ncbi:MAG: DUF1036 domain-containing protein [Tateyamaria sp.]
MLFKRSAACALALAMMSAAGPVLAGLEICNGTDARHSIAIGYKDGDNWVSEGWWNIDPGACATPIKGDLKSRYYYLRANSNGRSFVDENYAFCTQGDAFTIVGDKDCVNRGYRRTLFSRIDTGTQARQFTYFFDATLSVPPAPAPAPAPSASAPGTWGEPYSSGTALFQDCVTETEAPFCTFHADGYKFTVYQDGRTPDHVFALFDGMWPGTPIEVSGDLTGVYDRYADVVLYSALPRQWNRWDSLLDQMQGAWYSESDPNEQFNILGSELEITYDGAYQALEFLSLSDHCNDYSGGEFLVRRDEQNGDALCYSIEDLSGLEMVLMYVPRANFHVYRKLD